MSKAEYGYKKITKNKTGIIDLSHELRRTAAGNKKVNGRKKNFGTETRNTKNKNIEAYTNVA